MHTGLAAGNWLRINVGATTYINLVVVYNRAEAPQRINGAVVSVINGKKKTKCGTILYNKYHFVYYVPCNGATGNTVEVMQPRKDYLQISEVEVFGGPNKVSGMNVLSYFKPTSQSSTGWGGVSSRAVDGNSDGRWGRGSVTHSAPGTERGGRVNWWKVDLLGVYPVYLVIIHNRIDNCCKDRIDKAEVYVGKRLCGRVKWMPNIQVYPINCKGMQGSEVRIVQRHNYLSLAEVQVMGTGGPDIFVAGSGNVMLLSENRPAKESSVAHSGVAQRAVDGNPDGHWNQGSTTHTNRGKNFWEVNLGKARNINLVVVYNRVDCCQNRINGVTVWAGKEKCGTISYRKSKKAYFINCNGIVASTVRLTKNNDYLSLAEVEVFGGAQTVEDLNLLSWRQKTSQSSTGWNGRASRAVDGDASGRWGYNSVTHTRYNKDNWWQVDLGATFPVYLVLVHNRKEYSDRINGAKVYLDKQYCGTIQYIPYRSAYPINCDGKKGRIVKIVQKNNYLSLAEVMVFGLGFPSGGSGGIYATNIGGWRLEDIPLGKIQKIPGGKLKLGNVFVIRGKHVSDAKQWVFNLMGTGKDIALHFNGRPKQKKIVLNSYISGKWQKEMSLDWPGLRPGQSFVIVVEVLYNGYKFTINKEKPTLIYPHRIAFKNVRRVAFGGPAGTWNLVTRSCLRENVDFNGGDITNFRTKTKSIDECASRCKKHPACVAFTFHKTNGHCWLKNGSYRHGTRNNNLISGTKFCYVTDGETPLMGGGNMILLSYNKGATQINDLNKDGQANNALDGNTDGYWGSKTITHTRTNRNVWWQVDLEDNYNINFVVIHNRMDCCQNRIDGAEVYVANYRCGRVYYIPGRNIYYIPCNGASGRNVKITLANNYLHMAEVQVYGGSGGIKGMGLLSYQKPTSMSSIAHGGRPERAVDGNANGWWSRGTSIHTNGNKNDWSVDLEGVFPVYTVIIHNRWDLCCVERINGAKVYVDNQLCGTVKWRKGVRVFPINCGGRKGKVVKISHTKVLNIAEVEVIGTGGPTQFGPMLGSGNVKLLSLRRPVKQVNIGWGGRPERAVDGYVDGYWGRG